jgi:succinate-acetate transporter protein
MVKRLGKPILRSRVIRLNLIVGILGISDWFMQGGQVGIVIALMALYGIIGRILTKEPIRIFN